jgi:hypothetical protein
MHAFHILRPPNMHAMSAIPTTAASSACTNGCIESPARCAAADCAPAPAAPFVCDVRCDGIRSATSWKAPSAALRLGLQRAGSRKVGARRTKMRRAGTGGTPPGKSERRGDSAEDQPKIARCRRVTPSGTVGRTSALRNPASRGEHFDLQLRSRVAHARMGRQIFQENLAYIRLLDTGVV